LLSGLLRPTRGKLVVAEQDLALLTGSALDRWRGRAIGFVPQRLHLINTLSVLDNLLLAQYLAGATVDVNAARDVLASVGLSEHSAHAPDTLSQGQAQRVAVARAVVNRPAVLIADEPTSSLDDANALRSLELLVGHAARCNATLLVASHDARIRHAFSRLMDLPVARESVTKQ
jgi:ABC-type lipoprotein export system ATPase subunit